MAEQQLWLFPQSKPLAERLGAEFFSQVPSCPGVYIMADHQGRVVYVGQSQNLRQRLNSYKNIHPERDARRLVRLAHTAVTIRWEECENAAAARLRENALLRHYRPKFNSANTHPESYGFIGLRRSASTLELWLTQTLTGSDELYGAFKGLRLSGYAALLRLLVRASGQVQSPVEYPFRLLSVRPPRSFQFELRSRRIPFDTEVWVAGIKEYLDGRSDRLIHSLREQLPEESGNGFWRKLHEADLETVQAFYERGTRRNRQLRERHGIGERLIEPAELDDLLVVNRDDSESGR